MSNQLDSQDVPGEDIPLAPYSQGQKPMVYHDFPIEMSGLKEDGSFEVRVTGQTPGGEMPEGVSVRASYDRKAMEIALGTLAGNRIEQPELVELGKQMSQMLLPGAVGELFKEALIALRTSGEGLRLQIRTDNPSLPLSTLPWEFCYQERSGQGVLKNEFLALNRHISITRYFAFGPPLPSVSAKDRYRVFIGLAGSTSKAGEKLNLDGDRKAILRAVQAVKEDGISFEPLMADPVTKIKILNAVAGSDVFHFGGHGDFAVAELDPVDSSIIRKGRLILGNQGEEIFESDDFARLLGNSTVRLVVLGACKSAESDGRNRWLGMAPALVRENIPAVVGMQFKVGDLNAARFFAAMYRLVLDGFSVDEAIFEGRQAVSTLSGVDNRDWGTPVLYLRAQDGILFQRPPKVEPAHPQHFPGISVSINVGESSGTIRGISIGRTTSAGLRALNSLDIDTDIQVKKVTETGVVEAAHIDELLDQ